MLQYGSTVLRSMEEESKGGKVFGCSLCSHPLDARRVGGYIYIYIYININIYIYIYIYITFRFKIPIKTQGKIDGVTSLLEYSY